MNDILNFLNLKSNKPYMNMISEISEKIKKTLQRAYGCKELYEALIKLGLSYEATPT